MSDELTMKDVFKSVRELSIKKVNENIKEERDYIIKNHRVDDKHVFCIGHCCDWHYRTPEEFKQFKEDNK